MIDITKSFEYKLVQNLYDGGTARALRSGALKMNHINEGLTILRHFDTSYDTMLSWVLHPCFQDDNPLKNNIKYVKDIKSIVIAYVIEYRRTANVFLCRPETDHYTIQDMPSIVLPEVKYMLIADKVQNKKDFIRYHYKKHERSNQLYRYFDLWLEYLGISNSQYESLCNLIDLEKNNAY